MIVNAAVRLVSSPMPRTARQNYPATKIEVQLRELKFVKLAYNKWNMYQSVQTFRIVSNVLGSKQ